jgi:hypothetical protein
MWNTSRVRALVVSNPLVGHLVPLIPLARSLASAGHEVRVATGADMHQFVQRAGFSTIEAGRSSTENRRALAQRYPEVGRLDGVERHEFLVPRLFGEIVAPALLVDLERIVEEWPPEVIVHEVADCASPVVAVSAGCVKVTVGAGPGASPAVMQEWADRTAPLWRARGLEPPPWAGLYEPLRLEVFRRRCVAPTARRFPSRCRCDR